MEFSSHSLHSRLRLSDTQKQHVEGEFLERRRSRPKRIPFATPASIQVQLTTVSLDQNFDAYVDVSFAGASVSRSLLMDSGNSTLIVPYWEDIAAIPNYELKYKVLGNAHEPWGCPANVVQGPIELPTADGSFYTIENCVFYACTDNLPGEATRTANFGAGCITPWNSSSWNTPPGLGVTLQSPLSYDPQYSYAEFIYVPAGGPPTAAGTVKLGTESLLVLHQTVPAGYKVFDIIPNKEWMSLKPKALSIGGVLTTWPGVVPTAPIALIDTGGGPVFLSDPNECIANRPWPDPAMNPDWTEGSVGCESIKDNITIELGDGADSFTYTIDESALPADAQGLTLVMCEKNLFMMGEQGMNIGGISALFNDILVDYRNAKVGLKAK